LDIGHNSSVPKCSVRGTRFESHRW